MLAQAKGNTLRPVTIDEDGETHYISMEVPTEVGSSLDSMNPRPPLTQEIVYDSLPFFYRNLFPFPQEDVAFGRLFFISTNGFTGSVPEAAKAGDHICVFLSGAKPVVLRPKMDENDDLVLDLSGSATYAAS